MPAALFQGEVVSSCRVDEIHYIGAESAHLTPRPPFSPEARFEIHEGEATAKCQVDQRLLQRRAWRLQPQNLSGHWRERADTP
jgi:hypothetical protein